MKAYFSMNTSVLLQITEIPWYSSQWVHAASGIIIIIILLILSAIVSGAEVALFSLGPQDLHALKHKHTKRSEMVLKVLAKPRRMLATLLIANNAVNIAIIILSTFVTFELFDLSENPVLAFVIQAVVISIVLLFFGEILPKVYATHSPLNYAQSVVPMVVILQKIFYPLAWIMARFSKVLDNRQIHGNHGPTFNELSDAIELTKDGTNEHRMLKGIVNFGEIDVKEIMIPRMDIASVALNTTFEELRKIITETGYSRIPAYNETLDQIAGILYIKDLLPHLAKNDFDWKQLVRPAMFVPEQKKINDLLQEFREKKIHMAIVVDEYGGTSGIVTLEDVIEEVVGEINDEYDTDDSTFIRVQENEFVFEGKTLLNDFCKILGIDTDTFEAVKGESETLAGLMLELVGKIPEKNDKITCMQFDFHVEASDKRRIKKIRVLIKPENELNHEAL
ncbi:MAG: gliding motility-associated protein GldE [Bacteroidota bacterium]